MPPPQPPNKSYTLPSGTKYAYYFYPPTSSRPTLLFLHGFPSTSHEWRYQLSYFRERGYGVLVPDLLGYGLSSKPLEPSAYLGSIMAADILFILEHENLADPKGVGRGIVGIAHDWGTYLLSQLTFRYPSLFNKVIFTSVPYQPPGRTMNIDKINTMTKKAWGYEQYGYWLFFQDPAAGEIMGQERKWQSFFALAYAADSKVWESDFAGTNAMKNFVTSERATKIGPWVGSSIEDEKAWHRQMFGSDYTPALNWYRRAFNHLGQEDEKKLLQAGKVSEKIEGKDVLMVCGSRDAVCPADKARGVMGAFVEPGRLRCEVLDAGHWVMLEQRDQFNRLLENFIEVGVSRREKVKI